MMWEEGSVYQEDLKRIINESGIPWQDLEGKSILITGATGLIGSSLVNALLYYGLSCKNPPRVLALVRNGAKAEQVFGKQRQMCSEYLEYICADVCSEFEIDQEIDYIIHAASQTASQAFVMQPVETIETAIRGTKNMLELARKKKVQSFIYLSSMEVYGFPERGHAVTEDMVAGFDTTTVRNCYPISKQMCENLCCAYQSEYGVPARIVRLTQTFGPGVQYDDKRVFAEFMRCVIEKRNIVLKTEGKTERCYLYLADAVTAILTVMLKGENGQAYTAANPKTYCSIREMAQIVAEKLANNQINVVFELQDVAKLGYADTLYMDLNTDKLETLGWRARVDLEDMYGRTLQRLG